MNVIRLIGTAAGRQTYREVPRSDIGQFPAKNDRHRAAIDSARGGDDSVQSVYKMGFHNPY